MVGAWDLMTYSQPPMGRQPKFVLRARHFLMKVVKVWFFLAPHRYSLAISMLYSLGCGGNATF